VARLTRSESQARTRENLLNTARAIFLAEGYAGTSLERVAEAAGYSKGAVYSNFHTKSDLCLEVLASIHETKLAEVTAELVGEGTLEDRVGRLRVWAERTLGDVEWTLLEFEFAVAARDDPRLQAAIASNLAAMRGMVAAQLAALAADSAVELSLPVEEAADLILSVGLGVGIQRAVDPSISVALLSHTVRMVLRPNISGDSETADR
jgi:AcrR family transcriptional regulator